MHPTSPPEAWRPVRRLARAVARPIERFLLVEAAGGIILLIVAAVALVWANSRWHEGYGSLWHTPITFGVGAWSFTESLHFWINDGLMTVFFLVVGLEIKRELTEGALADLRRAALPIAAAVGGMLVPAAFYAALNTGPATRAGWGVPMATDIAFAVGVLTLLGKRVPPPMRILLLALAIIDDIGAILVIALFYSAGFATDGLLIVALGIIVLFALQQIGTRPGWSLAIPLGVIWIGLYQAGIHPTIAGVIVGLASPVRSWIGRDGFMTVARQALDDFSLRVTRGSSEHELIAPLDRLAFARREAISPALRLENALHPWVAYGIMPLFALANAGVYVRGIDFAMPEFSSVMLGVTAGLVIGKPLGITAVSWLAVRLRLCVLPPGVTWVGIMLIGTVAGIGFTMAIFIAELAFADPALLGVATFSVLTATAVAATISLVAGRVLLPLPPEEPAEPLSASDIEASTDYWTGELPTVSAQNRTE